MLETNVAVLGDTHGHLQLGLSVLASWQMIRGEQLEAVFLCGDVGTFTDEKELDNATRRHARDNAVELEFLTQWSTKPPAPWLEYIFKPLSAQGLGLDCPVIFVHGNHDGFSHLREICPPGIPETTQEVESLPRADSLGRIYYLPSGWTARLDSGLLFGGIGGVDAGQRLARYDPMAYLTEDAVTAICTSEQQLDLLITHQGPAKFQKGGGSELLDLLLDKPSARSWFHGHSTLDPKIHGGRPGTETLVVPLGDIAFTISGADDRPGSEGWAWVQFTGEDILVDRTPPSILGDFRMRRWYKTRGGLLVCPPLAGIAWRIEHGKE